MHQCRTTRRLGAALVVGLGLYASPARADVVLTPGSTESLSGQPYDNTAGDVAPGATLIASTAGQLVNLIPGGLAGVTVNEAVYQEANGQLDFLYQVVNGSTQALGSVALSNFTDANNVPFTISTGFATVLPSPAGPFTTLGTVGEPTSETRTPGLGSQDTLTFSPSLAAGASSEIFWERTNATTFDNLGSITVNGNTQNVGIIFEPTSVGVASVPEPSPILLGGLLGLVGLGVFHIRKRVRLAAIA